MDKIYARVRDDGSIDLPFGEQEQLRHRPGAIVELTIVGDAASAFVAVAERQMLPLGVVVDGLRLRGCCAGNAELAALCASLHGVDGDPVDVRPLDVEKGLLIETDVIADFLTGSGETSILEAALKTAMCYTTFIQLGEILACVPATDQGNVLQALSLLRPLGVPSRYAPELASFLREVRADETGSAFRTALTATIARQSALTVCTVRHRMVYSRLEISTINGNALRL
ncbi:MAG: hypothetical protein ACKOAG_09515 [Candidatus Kapaibacterium sp.]